MEEVDALRRRILALESTLTTLLDVLQRAGTLSTEDRAVVRAASRAVDDEPVEAPSPMLDAGSPYRGGGPGRQALVTACVRCGRAIEKDDAELSLGAGRVCIGCYSRGV